MQITQLFTWPVTNWPSTTPTSQYTVLQVYPGASVEVSTVATNSTTLSFDDAIPQVFQVRPSSGSTQQTRTYGPEITCFVVGSVPCRAWLRTKIRQALSDRADQTGVTLNWPDDEINNYVEEAMNELNVRFPVERNTTVLLQAPTVDGHGNQVGTRNYALPADFYQVKTAEYVTVDEKLHLFLKEKPWRGGETSATSYLGYPKLGIMLSPLAGRFYPGHYFIFQNQFWIDWDPPANGDFLNINYTGRRAIPTTDADILEITPEDMELLSLYTQMKCWIRVEGQDTRLSRWRGMPDGSNRADMPTVKHSMVIKQMYNERVNDRRELRPRVRRLVRR